MHRPVDTSCGGWARGWEVAVCGFGQVGDQLSIRAVRGAFRYCSDIGEATGGLLLPKVERKIVAEGEDGVAECAVRADMTSPAAELLGQLHTGYWPDPLAEELPDSWQPSLLLRLVDLIEKVTDGYDPDPGQYNYLRDGIWEFKVTNLRLTFYDTDGDGNAMTTNADVSHGWDGKRKYSLPAGFGRIVRLGHHFAKTTRQTAEDDLGQAGLVREEDLNHDRRN